MATMKVCVVGGGGGGANTGSGGGAGGYVYNSAFTVIPKTYAVTVGGGGLGGASQAAAGAKGSDSIFSTITAEGGGLGQTHGGGNGGNGGSGGGGAIGIGGYGLGGTGSQGNAGGNGMNTAAWVGGSGGGGGAGGAGSDGTNAAGSGNGGVGIANPISGSTSGQNVGGTYYLAGGGGGSEVNGTYSGTGGNGGGGAATTNAAGTNGTANTGGGGGGGAYDAGTYRNGGNGGSGIVIISWVTADFGTCTVTGAGNAITTSGANSIATFIVSGNFSIPGVPTVTTEDVTSIFSTNAVGNGTIVEVDGINAYQRGIAYGQVGTDITFGYFLDPSFEGATNSFSATTSTDQQKYGAKSAKLVWSSGSEANLDYGWGETALAAAYSSKTLTFGCWVWCASAGKAALDIYDDNGSGFQDTRSSYHTGDSTWQYLSVTRACRASLSTVLFRLHIVSTSACTAYFDGVIVAISDGQAFLTFDSGDYGAGAFSKSLTGLTANTAYKTTAFATNDYGVGYGINKGFTSITLPTVTTQDVTSISSKTATGNGNITSTGGSNPYQRGVAYGSVGTDITFIPFPNPSFEEGFSGWGGAGDIQWSSTQVKYGFKSVSVAWASGTESFIDYTNLVPATYESKTLTFGCYVWCATPNIANIKLFDHTAAGGYQNADSSFHTGNSTWQFLTVFKTIRAGIDYVFPRIVITTSSAGVAYFDGIIMAISDGGVGFSISDGNYSTGAFTQSLTLDPKVAYKTTAFASNVTSTGYGVNKGFTSLSNIKSYNTNTFANIKSINTNLIANVKSLNTNV